MVPRPCYLACMAIAFWALPASAQPLFRVEHNWTVTAGEHIYGLRQVLQMPDDIRFTQIWIGRCTSNMRCRAEVVIALILRPPADFIPKFCYLVDWRTIRRLP
jgi:hypothetical protein